MFGNDISQVAAQAREFERSGKRDKFLEESANAVYDDGEGRQLFPVEIDPAMDRYLRQKGEGWQADAYRSWQRGKMLAADLRKGGDDPMKAEKERVLGEERAKVQEYVNERTRRGMPLFPDALAFKSAQEDEAEYARRKDKVDWHRSVFNGDLKKVPESVKKEFEAQFFPDNELGDELRARSLVLGWALDEGGYTENQVSARNGVPLLEQMAIRLKEQGEQIDFNKPGLTVYRFLSRRAQEDAHADELLKGAAESVRQAVLTGGDGRQALWEQRGQMGEDMYKKVGNTLRWVKADAERTRRGLEPVLPRVMEGLEWAVKYADGTANRIFQPEGMASIHQALKAMDGLTDAQMDALAEIVQRKGGNEGSYMANVWKAGNRGWEDLGNGIRSLLRGGIAAQLDVAGGVKELFGGDGSALKADAKAADEYGRRLDAFLAMAQGTYRPINKPEYGWFGNGVLSAVRSVPITALSFSGVGAGVAAMSYAGDSYSKAVQERPDGGRLARLGGAAASGAVQGALERAGAMVSKGMLGLRSGSAFVDKWMSKLSLSRQAMRLKSSALRAGARSGVAGGMVLGEEMTTEKLQDLADPVMQSLASVMAGEAPGIDWERFWKDFTNRDQNMELFGSVLAFALVGAGARFTAEAGMQRQLSREYGKLKRTFGFSDSLLARMRAEESDVARYAMMQDGIQDFMRQNYGKEVDGVKVGLGDADGMRKLAARGGVRTMDVVAAAEAHAAETARGVDEVRVDGAEVQEGKGAVVGVKGPESGGVSEVGSGPVLSFEHGPVPERKGGRQVDEKEAMKQYVEAVNEQLREFGASPIREEMNEFTEEMQYVVELGDRPEFYDTYDDAYEAVLRHLEEREDEVVAGLKSSLRQYRDKDEGYVGRVQDEANEEMMQHLSDVGQDGRMSFDRSKLSVPMTLAQLKTQGDFMRKSAEGRERIYAAQMGVEAGVDAARLRVYGANVAQEFANGRYEVVSRLYRGANPFDVYEEWTEGMTKVLIKDNEWTVAEFEDELKRLEGATGETFLATGEGVDRLQAVCEGVSKAARAHLMGHISDERLPDKLRRWFKMFALLFAKYFEFAQDVMLAKKMLGADVQGKMSEKFRRLLNDFAGFDEAAIAERARREEQAQIEAEAMGDVPEIGEWVAGRLPHPKTAAEAGSDLTGELQRIYDALTTTRTAKGRRRKDGTLGKSFEQRVVARAEQFFSREGRVSDVLEAANEAGFDFADSGELLSAVYDSVVYGYKRYAARGEGQEVSFSMGDRVRRVPMAEARRVADAFHRVEGMEPVAADVPAAYASDLKDALGDIRERYRVLQKETQEQGYALVMGDGKRVQVGGKGWREVKQHAADRRVLAALAVLPELAGRAEFIYSGENSDLKRKPNIARFHYYLTKADFKGASDDGSADLAYVNIAVAEGKNGELFYDLDASTVEDVDSMKGTSATLQRPRVPNTGEAGDGVPHKGRVALLKEFVNYVDRDLAGQGREGREVSVQDVEAQGGFDEHGVLAAENAVVVKPDGDVTMSVRALHASPHSFRKFDTAFMGKGEGAQAYGWGLYFAESEKVNRDYMNWFAQDNATWKFGDVETSNMEVMHQALYDRLLPKDALPEVKEDASDMIWTVLGDLSDARGDEGKIEAIKKELREDIQHSMEYGSTYHQTLEKLEQLEGFMLSLLDHLDEIEIRTGMPSNYKVELNVEDSELLGWDYVDETVLSLLKDSPVEEVRYALEHAERRADYRGENVSGKDVYQELFDAFWDGEDGTKQEAQKAASVSLLSSDIKGIRYADGYTRGKVEEEQTYNYVIFDGNDIKITAFADESTGGAWADYEDPTATFSIIGEKAASFQEYHNNGLSYTDPADGKRKAIIDSRGVRLRKEHVSVSEGGHVNVSLAAALDFPELFRAYPELRKLRVDFYRDSRSGTGGFTDPQEHYIAVNVARGGKNAAPGMVLDTILHEVQHVIQGYEGFAQGAGNMSREQALAYLGESMSQLAGRDDAWAKEALPRLERMRQELEAGTLQPAFVYVFSHGEQEARLAGSFEKNSEGVVMSGLNGFRLLDAPPFSIPLTGDITELGGITFGAGRFGRMAGRVLAPNGDWLYDEMVFRMRAAAQRSVSKLRLFETGDRERGLELLAEAQELISTVERFLPHTYGFGLEPYKIWLNVFSLLYGNSGKMAPGDAVASALEAIPMKRWPEIMEGSIGKSFVNWAEKRPELEDVVEEARREIAERQADYELDSAPDADNRAALAARKGVEQEVWRRLFEEHGAEFLEEYGEQKVFRLVGKFMARVVEQIDRFRKDRTLGRIRRVAASVAPRTNPQGKPLRGKMDAESYRRLEDRLRLMEMTPAQYDAFFRKNFPEVLDEEAAGQQEGRTLWEDVKPQDMVTVETTDAEGGALALTVTKATFEAYACYEKMSVETAENAARALGEFIATRREAWENAAESKKNEIEDLLRPVLEAAGRTDDQAMATHRKQARLKTLPSGPMSLTGYLLNFSQYMQGLQSVPAFRGIAKKFERRAARFAVQKQACEKDTLAFVKKAAGRILQTEDEYEIADWIYEQRGGLDTGLTITEQEPDWQGKAREEYRAGVLNLIRRKVRKRGAARTLAHVAFLMKDMDAELKAEIERIWPDARDEVWSEKDAAVFTEKELDRYGSQEKYVEEHAARARKASKWGKGKSPYQAQSYKLDHISRMEAAYIILLSQQEDYQEMLRLKGFTQEILEGLEQFAGSEVMEFSRALREKLNERGQEVKEVTESRYGAPFPMIENYFRAFFDVGIEAIDQSIMDAASYGDAATGGKFGLIHARKKHHASLDLSIDVLTAYYAAMNEQDVYLYGSEISRDMRALINYRGENGTRGARVLEKVIGRDALNKLLVWCDSFDKGMAGNVRGFLEMQKSLNRISSAAAITLLPGRVGTWLKQSTALINAAFSSDEIDPHEWAASMARMAAGKLALSPRELMKRAALDARDATETAVIREAMSADEAGRAASGAWKRLNVKGMNLLTQTDVGLNAVSSAILYDAVYRKEMKRNPGLSREEADRRAMMEVELSLSRKAQPMTPQQRSLAAQTRSVWNVGMLFLGGESINTFAETVALWKQGGMKNKAKSVSMFYAHGLLLASMSAMLNFFTDDERRRKRREWWHIFIDALQGPLQGIPFLGALAGGAVRGMSSLCGYRYYEATTSLVPFASWDNLERAGKDLAKLFDGKDKDWVDFPLAFMGALRMAAFGAALGGASTPKGARFKAAAFSAAAFVNLTEFLLRAMKGLPLRLDGK